MSDAEDGSFAGAAGDDSLPKAPIAKLIAEVLGGDMICARDAKDLVAECAKEFITLVASEGNELADKTAKKTLTPEHIQEALKSLGFETYCAELGEAIETTSAAAKVERQRKSKSAKSTAMTDEELAAAQEALFAASRAKMDAGEA